MLPLSSESTVVARDNHRVYRTVKEVTNYLDMHAISFGADDDQVWLGLEIADRRDEDGSFNDFVKDLERELFHSVEDMRSANKIRAFLQGLYDRLSNDAIGGFVMPSFDVFLANALGEGKVIEFQLRPKTGAASWVGLRVDASSLRGRANIAGPLVDRPKPGKAMSRRRRANRTPPKSIALHTAGSMAITGPFTDLAL